MFAEKMLAQFRSYFIDSGYIGSRSFMIFMSEMIVVDVVHKTNGPIPCLQIFNCSQGSEAENIG